MSGCAARARAGWSGCRPRRRTSVPGFDVLAAALGLHLELEVVETGRFAVAHRARSPARPQQPRRARASSGCTPPTTFEFRIRSAIPLSGGLGSSAAAVVAGLMAADHLFELRRRCRRARHRARGPSRQRRRRAARRLRDLRRRARAHARGAGRARGGARRPGDAGAHDLAGAGGAARTRAARRRDASTSRRSPR